MISWLVTLGELMPLSNTNDMMSSLLFLFMFYLFFLLPFFFFNNTSCCAPERKKTMQNATDSTLVRFYAVSRRQFKLLIKDDSSRFAVYSSLCFFSFCCSWIFLAMVSVKAMNRSLFSWRRTTCSFDWISRYSSPGPYFGQWTRPCPSGDLNSKKNPTHFNF